MSFLVYFAVLMIGGTAGLYAATVCRRRRWDRDVGGRRIARSASSNLPWAPPSASTAVATSAFGSSLAVMAGDSDGPAAAGGDCGRCCRVAASLRARCEGQFGRSAAAPGAPPTADAAPVVTLLVVARRIDRAHLFLFVGWVCRILVKAPASRSPCAAWSRCAATRRSSLSGAFTVPMIGTNGFDGGAAAPSI